MSGWAWFAMLGGLAGFAWAVWPARGGLAIPARVGGSLWLVSGLVLCAESLFISDPKGGLSQAKATQRIYHFKRLDSLGAFNSP